MGAMTRWWAMWRMDQSEAYETDSWYFDLPTGDLVEAATRIAADLGSRVTLLEVRREM